MCHLNAFKAQYISDIVEDNFQHVRQQYFNEYDVAQSVC